MYNVSIEMLEHVKLHFGTGRVSPSEIETHQENSSELSIPVLEHLKLNVGTARVSVLKIMIKIAITPGASL